MNRKTLSAAVIAAAVCANVGSLSCGAGVRNAPKMVPVPVVLAPASKAPENQDAETTRIASQFSKFDPWLSSIVDVDYSDGKREGTQIRLSSVPIRILIENSGPAVKKLYGPVASKLNAFYIPEHNSIILAEDWKLFIDHELAHALGKFEKGKLRISLDDCDASAINELTDMLNQRSKRASENGVYPILESVYSSEMATLNLLQEWSGALIDFKNATDRIKKATDQGKDRKDKQLKQLIGVAELLYAEVRVRMAFLDSISSAFEILDRYRLSVLNRLDKTDDICQADIEDFVPAMKRIALVTNAYFPDKGDLDGINAFNANARNLLPPTPEDLKAEMKEAPFLKNLYADINLSFLTAKHFLLYPNEIFARMLDSGYSVSVAGDCWKHPLITDLELDALGKLKRNGRPVFGKLTDKYRLALRMKEDGMDPKEISRQLEFATHFEYKGKRYDWPKLEIRIIGKLSRITRLPLNPWEYEGESAPPSELKLSPLY